MAGNPPDDQGELSPRKEHILRAVIVEYVSAAEPVSSDHVADRYRLGVRSATVRGELAELTQLGFLEQPHTSAGRIPSDLGYRYYVDRLRSRTPASGADRSAIRSAQDDDETLSEILSESTRILARLTRLCAAAATMKDSTVAVRQALLTAVGPGRAMLILVLGNGHVENRIIEMPPGTTLEQIGGANDALAANVVGKTLGQLQRIRLDSGEAGPADLLAGLTTTLRSAARDLTRGHFVTAGEEYVVSQPEFLRNSEISAQVVSGLEDEAGLRQAVLQSSGEETVTIGREHKDSALHPLAISRRIFFIRGSEAGALAIIGPTRQDYDRSLALLEYTAGAISQTLSKIFD
ncbi:MAG: heat-inducible transcriptional repressor HrcA [Fimbriimonadaceae bacterium]|nr:heat-inducible transcriptional repressor HrcA [Fimbriimonadaceae bacterium]